MPPPRPIRRPKRPANTSALPPLPPSSATPSNQTPQFDIRNPSALVDDTTDDNPPDDAFLTADIIGKRGAQIKRNAVEVDGYGSDSSNEGFDGRAQRKQKQKRQKEKEVEEAADDGDMFGDLASDDDGEEKPAEPAGKEGKKNVRFLAESEIEGQVDGSKSGGHVSADFSLTGEKPHSDSDDESDAADSERAELATDGEDAVEIGAGGKKSHAPKLDAFNMKSEQQEGRFDDQGNYVRKAADADAGFDSWLDGVSKKDMKKAKEAAEKREGETKKKRREEDGVGIGEVVGRLIVRLEIGETALEALARLGRGKKAKGKKTVKRKGAMDLDEEKDVEEEEAETRRKAEVEAITEAADLLYSRGQVDVYEMEREALARFFVKETGDAWMEPKKQEPDGVRDLKQWEYRWSDARDGGEVHGPYEGGMMVQWSEAGYFGDGVEFREVGGKGWSRVVDFV